jgi:hypothetical protein
LAESLSVLKALQEGGRRVFRSADLSRVHRERLVQNGFLQDVMKGWLISSNPGARVTARRGMRRTGYHGFAFLIHFAITLRASFDSWTA